MCARFGVTQAVLFNVNTILICLHRSRKRLTVVVRYGMVKNLKRALSYLALDPIVILSGQGHAHSFATDRSNTRRSLEDRWTVQMGELLCTLTLDSTVGLTLR